jgi:ubiquinone/menaquinone biosynthesis C-methylase UbiE
VPLPRTLEPEVMDTEQEASDYDAMDHSEVNERFCNDLLTVRVPVGRVLDVGTGTARIPIELCRRAPDALMDAIDLSTAMVASAHRNIERAGLAARIRVGRVDGKSMPWNGGTFDVVMSNSAMHHMEQPQNLLREMWRVLRAGGLLFVRDLARPESGDEVRQLVAQHAPVPALSDPATRAMRDRQRALFEASLHAALTSSELISIAMPLGIPAAAVRRTSDRHWTLGPVQKPDGL